jgi:hypothetical protein
MVDQLEDGIVCEAAWKKAKVKVFHLLKEKTGDLTPPQTLGKLFVNSLRNCQHRNGIAYKLAARTLAIYDEWENKKRPFKQIEQVSTSDLACVLESTAIANLIKNTTCKTTSDERLEEAVTNDDPWHKQIQEAKPHIVLCAGPSLAQVIWNHFSINLEKKERPRRDNGGDSWGLLWGRTPTDLWYFLHDDCIYLQFYHPSYYGKKQEDFHALLAGSIGTVREALENKKILNPEGDRLGM